MKTIPLDEIKLSRIIYRAQNKVEVFDDSQSYIVPVDQVCHMSGKHFIAHRQENNKEVVLNYKNVRKILIDNFSIDNI